MLCGRHLLILSGCHVDLTLTDLSLLCTIPTAAFGRAREFSCHKLRAPLAREELKVGGDKRCRVCFLFLYRWRSAVHARLHFKTTGSFCPRLLLSMLHLFSFRNLSACQKVLSVQKSSPVGCHRTELFMCTRLEVPDDCGSPIGMRSDFCLLKAHILAN